MVGWVRAQRRAAEPWGAVGAGVPRVPGLRRTAAMFGNFCMQTVYEELRVAVVSWKPKGTLIETNGCHVWYFFCMQTVNEERRVAGVGWEAQGYVETGGCQVGVGVSPR